MRRNSLNRNILIAGGSGLIGQALALQLTRKGYNVSILSRSKIAHKLYKSYYWNPKKGEIASDALSDKHYVINLTGESIAGKFWSKQQKQKILASRIEAVKTLSHAISKLEKPPVKFLSASAIGYYGSQSASLLTESSAKGNGFLADVCQKWETELNSISSPVVKMRIGVVLSARGGYLIQLKKILRTRVNMLFGKGDQYVSWIHISDLVSAIIFIMEAEENSSIYNLTSPEAVQMNKLSRELLNCFGYKAFTIHVNSRIIKWLLGSFSELFLSSQRVYPKHLIDQGFTFSAPNIKHALKDLT